jgi:glycosyltransferase involved in cell wall biosynthesis
MMQPVIALLGRKDEPTDALEEYCRYLGGALQAHEIQMEIRRVPWESRGWAEALRGLKLQAEAWRGRWVLVQYTALAWSSRGFPQKCMRVFRILKDTEARVGIVFHDVEPYAGTRWIDRLRRVAQVRTMRQALGVADLAIFTVLPEKLSWRPESGPRVAFVPVGANLPIAADPGVAAAHNPVPTVGVFSITGGQAGARETEWIIAAMRHAAAQIGKLRLSVFGRHAELRAQDLEKGLSGVAVELSVKGVIEPAEVVERLRACDVLLFVRGNVSTRRGSAIAGIACGLPVIAFCGGETAAPITEAGVVLVDPDALGDLNAALVRVLADRSYRGELAGRSREAYQKYFSWTRIANRVAGLLKQ